jgi:hypothetical protein
VDGVPTLADFRAMIWIELTLRVICPKDNGKSHYPDACRI